MERNDPLAVVNPGIPSVSLGQTWPSSVVLPIVDMRQPASQIKHIKSTNIFHSHSVVNGPVELLVNRSGSCRRER